MTCSGVTCKPNVDMYSNVKFEYMSVQLVFKRQCQHHVFGLYIYCSLQDRSTFMLALMSMACKISM